MYFSICFVYIGTNIFGIDETIETILQENNIKFKHQHTFPDGSFYKWITSTLSLDELKNKLHSLFTGNIWIADVAIADPICKPFKYNINTNKMCETLTEYMENNNGY